MSLTSDAVAKGKVKAKKNPKGRLIFTKKMPCGGCHQYAGRRNKLTGGRSGPSLVEAGVRLNPDWILAYLQKPKIFKPVKRMPVFAGLLSDKDMLNVARHVASFKPKKKK
jgi:cytochrome c553